MPLCPNEGWKTLRPSIGHNMCATKGFHLRTARDTLWNRTVGPTGARIYQKGTTHMTRYSRLTRNSVLTSYKMIQNKKKKSNCYSYLLSHWVCLTSGNLEPWLIKHTYTHINKWQKGSSKATGSKLKPKRY